MAIRLFNYVFLLDLYSDADGYGSAIESKQNTLQNNASSYQTAKIKKICKQCTCGFHYDRWFTFPGLQITALTCYFLSCKYWERFPPKVRNNRSFCIKKKLNLLFFFVI
jgi:hypothetical protein